MLSAKIDLGEDGANSITLEVVGDRIHVRSMDVDLAEEALETAIPKLEFISGAAELSADAIGLVTSQEEDEDD